ncbi:MAG: alginate lyase family protein [Candidatus Portnoybacteria bacterium]|nr:alginate lyase family protein [Candidatus Portnoybacteria bacterium]
MERKLLRVLVLIILAVTIFVGGCGFKLQHPSLDMLITPTGINGVKDVEIDLLKDFIRQADRLLEITPNPSVVLDIPPYYTNYRSNRKAVAALENDTHAALVLSLAYRLTGFDKYAIKATDFMAAWSSNCREAKSGESKLYLVYGGFRFLRAYQYLENFDWNRGPFKVWLQHVYRPAAEEIKKSANNWGSWGHLGCIMTDSILAPEFLDRDADDLEAHIKRSIGPNGILVYETKRTLAGIWYSYFSLAPMFRAAMELDRHGSKNLYSLILPGFDWFFRYCVDPDSWPYRPLPGFLGEIQKQIWPHAGYLQKPYVKNGWPAHLLETAARVYDRPQWLQWVQPPNTSGCHCFEYSTLVLSMKDAGIDIDY